VAQPGVLADRHVGPRQRAGEDLCWSSRPTMSRHAALDAVLGPRDPDRSVRRPTGRGGSRGTGDPGSRPGTPSCGGSDTRALPADDQAPLDARHPVHRLPADP
jgi:hypothetical protein